MKVINIDNKESTVYDNVHFKLHQKVYQTESQIIRFQKELMIVNIFKTEINGFWLYFAIVPEVLKRSFLRKMFVIEGFSLKVLCSDISYTLNGCVRFRYEGLRCFLITCDTRFEKIQPKPIAESKFWYLPKLSAASSDSEEITFVPKLQEVSVDLYYSIELKKTPIGEIRLLSQEQRPEWMLKQGLGARQIAVSELITTQGITHFVSQDPEKLFNLLFSIRSNDLTIKSNHNLVHKSTVKLTGLGLFKLSHEPESRMVYIVNPKSKSLVISPSNAQPHPTFVDLRDPDMTRMFDKLPEYKPQEIASLSKAYTWIDLKETRPDARQLLSELKVDVDAPTISVPTPEVKAEIEYVTPKKNAKAEESDSNKNNARLLTTADSMSEDAEEYLPSSALLNLNFDEDSEIDPQSLVYDRSIANAGLKIEEEMPEAVSLRYEQLMEKVKHENLIEQNVNFLEGKTLHSYFTAN